MKMKGKLVIISAPSGAGKTTIVKHLLSSGLNLEFSISATTREKRAGETEGKDYYFLTPDEFRKFIDRGEFVEWEEVYSDHFYGTLKKEIERIWSEGKHVLFDVDVKGGINLKRIFGKKALAIFVMPPSVEELEKRLLKRGTDSREKIMMRVKKAVGEMNFSDKFDWVIVNNDLENAKTDAINIISDFLG